jgi:sulfur carrier protein ThiS
LKITVKLTRSNETKNIEIKTGSTVQDLLKKINLKPDTIIVLEKNQPIPIDDDLKDNQEITIIQVSSGG